MHFYDKSASAVLSSAIMHNTKVGFYLLKNFSGILIYLWYINDPSLYSSKGKQNRTVKIKGKFHRLFDYLFLLDLHFVTFNH